MVNVFRHSAAALSAALAAPLAAGALALRPRWRDGWRERIGGGQIARDTLWIHAASVGEVTASARL
ncbi:MAG TPA: glycosyltransferase N-terminal domain-containing protein, partial [Myxococcota bacterium]|nr:glycosyltransferase N-terminal domain-containing protein [Myxococcota bacterium]